MPYGVGQGDKDAIDSVEVFEEDPMGFCGGVGGLDRGEIERWGRMVRGCSEVFHSSGDLCESLIAFLRVCDEVFAGV